MALGMGPSRNSISINRPCRIRILISMSKTTAILSIGRIRRGSGLCRFSLPTSTTNARLITPVSGLPLYRGRKGQEAAPLSCSPSMEWDSRGAASHRRLFQIDTWLLWLVEMFDRVTRVKWPLAGSFFPRPHSVPDYLLLAVYYRRPRRPANPTRAQPALLADPILASFYHPTVRVDCLNSKKKAGIHMAAG